MKIDFILNIHEFEWDAWNKDKIFKKHGVEIFECEEIFFNEPLTVMPDEAHSVAEQRYYALGATLAERRLFVVFTIRKNKIRVISARNMSKKERKMYDEKTKKHS
ncbi:MAG: BrnT family toxin [Elusimicrobia bacterium]|nr:BrnT family toxin [Elusimicrobiota bacterium]MBU2615057.1 BrnT family toxin [Elusimicrobiota bacterium]